MYVYMIIFRGGGGHINISRTLTLLEEDISFGLSEDSVRSLSLLSLSDLSLSLLSLSVLSLSDRSLSVRSLSLLSDRSDLYLCRGQSLFNQKKKQKKKTPTIN